MVPSQLPLAGMDHDTNLNTAAEWWAEQTAVCQTTRQHWESHPIVQATMTARRGAATSAAWLERRLPRAPLRALSLGAGTGLFELDLISRGAVASYDLVDITPQLMEGAAARAAELGFAGRIRCSTADINRIEIEPGAYDLITFVSALHHVERLEHVLDTCRKGLRPGGLFFISEYVGPNRFAFPPAHADLANEIYCSIDPRLRTQPVMPRPNPLDVAAADPTEAIRSEEILDLVPRFFPTAETFSADVCLTVMMWYGLNHDVVHETPEGHSFVRWLLEVDRALVRSGRLPTYQVDTLAHMPPE